mmetsp:Transcript_7087/g.15629  ORF Transcript_7087/g.15629 Transcript_7087/m.15629 type:complete len:467 (-) Transcript_7087:355-1755(-)|eukprot:g3154.t1 g3154   contig12:1528216-1529616(-)
MGSNQQQQPVVQTILESFTRCFNPVNDAGACGAHRCGGGGGYGSSASDNDNIIDATSYRNTPSQKRVPHNGSSSPTRATERLELNDKEWDDVFSDKAVRRGSTNSRKSSSGSSSRRSHHSNHSNNNNNMMMDTEDYGEVVARAKKAAHRMDPETLEQRSIKRKLEIFRTRDSPPTLPRFKVTPTGNKQQRCSSTPDELVLSDSSEDEIKNLTSKKRFTCGLGIHRADGSPISSGFAKFFNLGPQQNPFGLCFATPVRTSSLERVGKLSDDQLTTDEFLRRHGAGPHHATPDYEISRDESGIVSRAGEDDTITSTLYFDQKYSHVVETRPPMPLFHSQMIPCSESKSDELTKIIKKKQRSSETSSPSRQYHQQQYASVSGSSSTSSTPRVLMTPRPRKSLNIFAKTSPVKNTGNSKNGRYAMNDDAPPSPAAISMGKSSSVSSQSHDSNDQWRLRDPDILHSTAAEI